MIKKINLQNETFEKDTFENRGIIKKIPCKKMNHLKIVTYEKQISGKSYKQKSMNL